MQSPRRSQKSILFLALALPICLILIVFLSNRSLFLDSLNLARVIAESNIAELAQPLKYEQSAPLLFLFITKCITSLLGISEYTLRIFPLLSGISCLFLFSKAASKMVKWPYVILGIVWLGGHFMFVRYATEFKQYIIDAFICTLLIWLALKIKKLDNKSLLQVGAVGALSIWLSMPSIFILSGLLSYYMYVHLKAKHKIWPIFLLGSWLLLHFLIEYFFILQPAIHSSHMQNYHQNYFLQGRVWNLSSIQHDFGLIVGMIKMTVGKSGLAIAVAFILILVSSFDFIKRKREFFLLLVIPILAAFGASFLGKYSLIERLMLFSLPIFFFLILYGLQLSIEYLSRQKKWIRYSGFLILTISIFISIVQTQGFKYIFDPFEKEDNRTALFHINKHQKHSNTIISTKLAYPAYAYYTQYDTKSKDLRLGNAIQAKYGESISELASTKAKEEQKDVWILMGHMLEHEIDQLISELDKKGIIKNSYRTNRSAAILFSTQ